MKRQGWLLLAAILLTSLNLKTALAPVSPVFGAIQQDLGISRGVAGLLVTVPVLCLGLLAPVGPMIGRAFGRRQALLGSTVLIGAATTFFASREVSSSCSRAPLRWASG